MEEVEVFTRYFVFVFEIKVFGIKSVSKEASETPLNTKIKSFLVTTSRNYIPLNLQELYKELSKPKKGSNQQFGEGLKGIP